MLKYKMKEVVSSWSNTMEYILDVTIERDVDRLAHVEKILNTLSRTPSPKELEKMASYIMYGKDENGQNSVQRGEVKDFETKKFKDFKTGDDRNTSLEEFIENPLTNQQELKPYDAKRTYVSKRRTIKRPRYDKKTGEMIDPGDSDIPGMTDLWENIDRLEHTIAANEGKLEFNPNDTIFTDDGKFHAFKHMVIDIKRHQYYLKDYYKQVLKPQHLSYDPPPPMKWDEDTFYWLPLEQWEERIRNNYRPDISENLDDYETRTTPDGKTEVKWVIARHNFSWENTWHIRQLIKYYADLYMENWDKLNSWARALIFDFDRYFDKCGFSELREFVLVRYIDGASFPTIQQEVQQKFGIDYSYGAVTAIVSKEIPNAIANMAIKERLMRETPDNERKYCTRCKRYLPASTMFFVANRSKARGLQSWCKECDKQYRIMRGAQEVRDARCKDKTMHKVPPTKKYY